jgi:hypothetical protein
LLWARRRIEFHLAKGETQEAIGLAKASNIVCEGAAFIAWDEVEKVPVSGREVYQPAMAPRMVAGAVARFRALPAAPARGFNEITRGGGTYGDIAPSQSTESSGSLMDRVRRVFSQTADLRKASNWRNELEKDALFQTVAGRQLLDSLGDWVRSQPQQWEQSLQKLMPLCKLLRESSAQPPSQRLQIVRQWITEMLVDQFRTNALEKLRQIEDELQARQ